MKDKKILKITIALVAGIICSLVFFTTIANREQDYFNFNLTDKYTVTTKTSSGDNRISENFHLKAAEYRLKIKYTSDSDITLMLRSIAAYDADTDSWAVLLEEPLPKGDKEIEFTFTTDQMYDSVMAAAIQSEPVNLVVHSMSIESASPVVLDSYAFSVACGAIAFIFVLLALGVVSSHGSKVEKCHKLITLLTLLIMFLLCTKYMWDGGTMLGDDSKFHLARVQSIANSFSIGQIPSMTGTGFNFGYGYMNSAFYPELFMYLPGFLVFLGVSVGAAIKILALATSLLGCFICYYSFCKISKSRSVAISCSAIYMLSFYKMQNFYVRMAVGEFLFMTFLPLVIYGIYNILYEKDKKWWILAIGATSVFQSHILGTAFTAVVGGTIIAVALGFMLAKKKNIRHIIMSFLKATGLSLALSAFFTIPFLYYNTQDFVLFSTGKEAMQAVYNGMLSFKTLVDISPESAIAGGIRGTLGLSIIITFIIGVLLFICNIATSRKWNGKNIMSLSTTGLILALSVLATSKGLWEFLAQVKIFEAIANIVQYPFRFTGLITFCVSLLACLGLGQIKEKRVKYVLAAVLCVLAVHSSYTFFNVVAVNVEDNPRFYYPTDAPSEYLLEGTEGINLIIARDKKEMTSEGVTITEYSKKASNIDLSFENVGGEESYIEVPLFYYSGYRAYLDGKRLDIARGDTGIIRVMLGGNQEGNIHIGYYGFWFFKAANLISLCGVCGVFWLIFYKNKRKTE